MLLLAAISVPTSKSEPQATQAIGVMQVAPKKPGVTQNNTQPTAIPIMNEENVCVSAMKQIFPKETWQIGYAIMKAESDLDPNQISSTNDYGCWQIHDWELYDPIKNTEVAYYKYTHYGWSPWTVYKTGAYLKWMP